MSDSPSEADIAALPKTRYQTESLRLLAIVIVAGMMAQRLTGVDGIAELPLRATLKDALHLAPEQASGFIAFCALFYYLKPVAGILADAFPLFNTRRRHYMMFAAFFAACAWVTFGLLPIAYAPLLVGAIVVNLFIVMISTITGGFLVEVGQSRGVVGKLTGIRLATDYACQVLTGPIGGFLAGFALSVMAGVNAFLVLGVVPVAYFLLKEKPNRTKNYDAFKTAGGQFRTIARFKPFWMALVFIALFEFAPGFGTLLYYRQKDILKLSTQTIGFLYSAGAIGGILASLLYILAVHRLSIKALVVLGVAAAGPAPFAYFFYNSLAAAYFIDFLGGFCFGLANVALVDLAARGTPAGCEALGFSCIISVSNLAAKGADWLGSMLNDTYHISWGAMLVVSGLSTLAVLLFLPFMPEVLMRSKDGLKPNLENTGEPAPARTN